MAKKDLANGKRNKKDEFYTLLEEIQKEVYNYPDFFKDKIVYCNCDDGEYSNFWRYFYERFNSLGLKKLIATSFHTNGTSYKYEFSGKGKDYNTYLEGVIKTPLKENGDFRSEECVKLLDECDVVVTNPPFSLLKQFVPLIVKHNKKFLILCNTNCVTYKEIVKLIYNHKVWAGYVFNKTMEFLMPDDYELKGKAYIDKDGHKHGFVPAISWITNIEHKNRKRRTEYFKRYSEEEFPKYDNYDAIEINKAKNIPCDYTGVMGVPITWLDKYCPDQFEKLGGFGTCKADKKNGLIEGKTVEYLDKKGKKHTYTGPVLNGEKVYYRYLIRWKPEAMPTIDENGIPVYKK